MTAENANKIKRLELENFTCFSEAKFDFSEGINVFIGENGTGKTHLLKVMYFMSGFTEDERIDLSEVFNVIKESRLIREHQKTGRIEIQLIEHGKCLWYILREKPENTLQSEGTFANRNIKRVLISPQEMFSWQEHFIGNNSNRASGFDSTWFDMAIALDRGILKGEAYTEAKQLVSLLEEAISAEVIRKDKKFYFRFHNNGQSEQEASVVAQGINKLGQIIYLILNGSIDKDTILFWDEPETGLNPKYITVVTKFLLTLANAGCQIFVSTHDYLLTHQLSLFASFRETEPDVPPMKFFSLIKGESGTQVESAETIAGIQHNPILDEYANYHELQLELFSKKLQTT